MKIQLMIIIGTSLMVDIVQQYVNCLQKHACNTAVDPFYKCYSYAVHVHCLTSIYSRYKQWPISVN